MSVQVRWYVLRRPPFTRYLPEYGSVRLTSFRLTSPRGCGPPLTLRDGAEPDSLMERFQISKLPLAGLCLGCWKYIEASKQSQKKQIQSSLQRHQMSRRRRAARVRSRLRRRLKPRSGIPLSSTRPQDLESSTSTSVIQELITLANSSRAPCRDRFTMVADAVVYHPTVAHYLRYVATTGMNVPSLLQR